MRSIAIAIAASLMWTAATPSAGQDNFEPPAQRLEVQLIRPVSDSNLIVGAPVFTPVGQMTRVHVELTNRSSRARTLEYEFEWFDADGAPRQTLSSTQTLFLDGGEARTIVSVSQRSSAVNARVKIGERRD